MARLFLSYSLVLFACIGFLDPVVSSCCEECLDDTVPLHRYHIPEGDHLYTVDDSAAKKIELKSKGYVYEKIAAYVFTTPAAGAVPLYNFYNGKDNLYTTDLNKYLDGQAGYKIVEITAYIYPSPMPCALPLYSYYNPGKVDSFYNIAFDEMKGGVAGWTLTGIAGYVYAAPQTKKRTTVPLYHWFSASRIDDQYTIDNSAANVAALGAATYTQQPPFIIGYCYPKPVTGTLPLYHYYSEAQQNSFYTTNFHEELLETGLKEMYTIKGIACYIYAKATDNTVPLQRYYKNLPEGNHVYNTDPVVDILNGTYNYELIAGYIFANARENAGECCK